MSSLNKVTLFGRLGADPDIRHTNDGRPIANMRIATSETWKDKNSGEKKEKTEWHTVVAFQEGLVKVIENYVKKGDQIYIEGQLQTRKWEDKEGNDRYTTEVVLPAFGGKVVLLGGSKGEASSGGRKAASSENTTTEEEVPW